MRPHITKKIQRIADLILAKETPKTDRDGYHYLYDPSHTKRPPTGFGRFYQTPKGWSTNPKYKYGKLPYNMVTGLTENEIKEHLSKNKINDSVSGVEEHKKAIIEKFDFINENEIESIEKIPSKLASLIDPKRFIVGDYNEYFVANVKNDPNNFILSIKKESDPLSINVVHELGHLALCHSKIMEDKQFVFDTVKSMEEEFQKLVKNIDYSFRNLQNYGGKTIGDVFNKVFLNTGRGVRRPSKIDVMSRVLYRKKVNEISLDEYANIGNFCDCIFVASKGTHGFGHDKRYLKDGGDNNRVHEFVAHFFEDSVLPNVLLRKHFPKTMKVITDKLMNKKGENEQLAR